MKTARIVEPAKILPAISLLLALPPINQVRRRLMASSWTLEEAYLFPPALAA